MTKPEKTIDIHDEILRVLDIEIEALESVRTNITPSFVAAVDAIAACSGQVFVAGVGKSGIIANKIAATMRSTGTPATFLHAGEALHGDVGMITNRDLILAIGKSGETTELNSLLRILRKNGTFIIAMTSNAESSMAALSNIVLDLKVPREACPLNLAPTASTTAALAVGDAIAVALMRLKNVSAEDFARHHPGGQIGARLLLTVQDVMRKGDDNPVISAGSSIKEMLVRMTAFRVGAISVIGAEGELLGLITDYDVRRILESEMDIRTARITDIMNPSPLVIHAQQKAVEALEVMKQRGKPTAVLPVVDDQRIAVGMVHLHDLMGGRPLITMVGPTSETILDSNGSSRGYWGELWRYRELVYFLSWRDIVVRYKQTFIGAAWAVIRPVMMMVVFTIVFGHIGGLIKLASKTPYPILVFAATLPWQFFTNALSETSTSVVDNPALLTKVYFPRVIIPLSSTVVSLVDFMVAFGIMLALMVWYRFAPSWTIVFLPFFIVLAFVAALGGGLWFAALNVRYRDFRYVIPLIVQVGVYVSPVGFSSSMIPEKWRIWYSLNPVVGIIDGFRWAILGEALYLPSLVISLVGVLVIFGTGFRYFKKTERGFADVI